MPEASGSLRYFKVTANLSTNKAKDKIASGVDIGPRARLPLDGPSDVVHPGIPLLLGAGVHLVHLGPLQGGADQEHGFLLIGHFPHDELL